MISGYLGHGLTALVMMAQACYNPEQAVELWRRMEKAEEHAPPQFLSTHPSSHNRIEAITTWLDEARAKQEQVCIHVEWVQGRTDLWERLAVEWPLALVSKISGLAGDDTDPFDSRRF